MGELDDARDAAGSGVAVFSPAPRLTITIESGSRGADEPHLHVGGQGPWAARMAAILGARVSLCVPLGGETGSVVGHLLDLMPLRVLRVDVRGNTAMYLHDRRGGQRHQLAVTSEPALDRHEFDDLYNSMLGAAIEGGVAVLTGTLDEEVIDADMYGRLVKDLTSNDVRVVADLAGAQLRATVSAGPALVKVSLSELEESGLASGRSREDGLDGIARLVDLGAQDVIVTRGAEPAVALVDGRRYEIVAPMLETVEHRGAGDSLTGAVSAALSRGDNVLDAMVLGAAAGALNVTRHGLATGIRDTIVTLTSRVTVTSLDDGSLVARPDFPAPSIPG